MRYTEQDLIDAARQLCYHFLSVATSDPRSGGWKRMADPGYLDGVVSAAGFLQEAAGGFPVDPALGERPPGTLSLEAAVEYVRTDREGIEREHRRIFGLLLAKDCPPYETEYCPQTFSVYRSQRIGDVAGYFLAFGLAPSRAFPERHDHISLELEFMAWVIGKARYAGLEKVVGFEERAEVCRRAGREFFEAHLCWWAPAFARALEKKAGRATFYGALGLALSAFVAFERGYLGIESPQELAEPRMPDEEQEMVCGECPLAAGPEGVPPVGM